MQISPLAWIVYMWRDQTVPGLNLFPHNITYKVVSLQAASLGPYTANPAIAPPFEAIREKQCLRLD